MSKKAIIITSIASLVFLSIAAVGLYSADNTTYTETAVQSVPKSYTLNTAAGEPLAFAKASQSIAQSAVDGTGTLAVEDCVTLGESAKNADRNALWFDNCENVKYGSIINNDTEETMKLSDGDYCATFTLSQQGEKLQEYSFLEGECGTSSILVR